MATKLKNLKISKVDFVDEGANPDADIKMKKRKSRDEQTVEGDSSSSTGSVLKKLFGFLGKAAGMEQSEIDSAVDEIQKGGSASFNDRLNEAKNRKISDEIWDICYALQSSLYSILNDEDLDGASVATAMQESLDEFYTVVQESISNWSSGKAACIVKKNEKVSEADVEIMKAAVERLNESIKKSRVDTKLKKKSKEDEDDDDNPKGDKEEMIDKTKLTEAERAFLESIEKCYGTDDKTAQGSGGMETVPASGPVEPNVTKSVTQPAEEPAASTEEADSIYKGLHPAVRAELESLKKFREEAEDRELTEVAKKYAIIGKKEDELVPLFKSLRAAGGTAYNDMIAVLDQAVTAVEKSGVFSEIGKSGHGSGTAGTAEAKIEAIAKGYMEKDSKEGG